MTALLVAITLASLALAGALAAYVVRLTREERDRSEARATALAEALAAAGGPAAAESPPQADAAPALPEVPGVEAAAVAGPDAALFGAALPRPGSPRLLLIPLLGVVIVGLALSAIYVWNRPTAQASTDRETAAAPLELLALRHARQGDALVITGLVRNPDGGRLVQGLTAVAFVFDRQGNFLSSSRALLDYPQLTPGDESPFSITVPDAASVGRYRISFRTDAGILPHLDRRNEAPDAVQQVSAR